MSGAKPIIAVIDYGLGNLRSVAKALEAAGAEARVTNKPEAILNARAIVFPGVGAFARGMENLEKLGILPALSQAVRQGKPFLGICLGMQLLFSESAEYGIHRGLDIIKGRVRRFDSGLKIPHMGWNKVKITGLAGGEAGRQIFQGIPDESFFYFAHTFYVEPEDKGIVAATTEYGRVFTSAISRDNVWGVQFHPEKSVDSGLLLLRNFTRAAA